MEIPFVVQPRKDTGLFNSKIAIWLFLASEVMLFGGFFSAYIFLRLGADYPWPERTLPVLPGLINTFILIGSSVTVVFAWASLKLRNWRHFQIYMGITIACAGIFMILKGVEYNVKFHHQAVRLNDYTIIEGHLAYELKDGADHHSPTKDDYELDHHGHKKEVNTIRVKADSLTYSTVRFHAEWVEELLAQASHHKSEIVLAEDLRIQEAVGDEKPVTLCKKGEPLSLDLLAKVKASHLGARSHNSKVRTESLLEAWEEAKGKNPGKKDRELLTDVGVDLEGLSEEKLLLTEIPSVTFCVEPPTVFSFHPRDIKEGPNSSTLRDDTMVSGEMQASPMSFHNVDAIDFRHLAMKAVEKGQAPITAIEKSWLITNHEFARGAWEWHSGKVAELEARLAKKGKEPTAKDRYRLGWKEFVKKAEGDGVAKLGGFKKLMEEFKGPNYAARGTETFPELSIPREEIRFASKFTPSWNTYYAIYFTITGLHGLHVVGGAIVLGYYLFFGRKMYETNPEWLANRVEVGGLFWHFVDLVWIFVFPIFYLM